MRATWLPLLAILAGCQRSEPAPSGSPSTALDGSVPHEGGAAGSSGAGGNSATGGSPSTATPPSCVVPLAEQPAPAQSPATNCPADPLATPPELTQGYVTFSEAPGAPRVAVEIADSDDERSRGLMYRTSMPEEQGMLFSWTDERPRSFWMRNTCIPLDMMFINRDGYIVGILEQVPVMNETSRSIPCPAAHVLEVNAGYSRSHGIKPGTRVAFE